MKGDFTKCLWGCRHCWTLAIIALLFSSCIPHNTNVLLIATAANVQYAMQELISEFEKLSQVDCDLVISSSGKITAQILEGAPFDVFVSADMSYPRTVQAKGMALEPPKIYARGKLIFWSCVEKQKLDLNFITNREVRHIAIANPKIAPYGKSAMDALRFYDLFPSVEPKLVYGESIAQVNQFIISGAVYGGFTSKSVVLAPQMWDKGIWIDLDQAAYRPIEQGVVVLKNTRKPQQSKQFSEFLTSAKAAAILNKYGYETGENKN